MTETRQHDRAKDTGSQEARSGSNLRVVTLCVGLVAAMGGMAYAAVPLYDLFCRVTGYGGTTQQAADASGVTMIDQQVTVRFDANTARDLPWDFRPLEREVSLRLGESMQIAYKATNTSSVPVTGTATFNVTPQAAGAYFNKIECFCFTETTLEPGESMEMPVVFFVDPAILDYKETREITTLTLSYTFFPDAVPSEPQAALATDAADGSAGG